jgi:hypothetical protein
MSRAAGCGGRGFRRALLGTAVAFLLGLAAGRAGAAPPRVQASPAAVSPEQVIDHWTGRYVISAHFLIFDLGGVGTMSIETDFRRSGRTLEKYLRLKGDVDEKHAQRYDYHGEFITRITLPLKPDGTVDEEAVREHRGAGKTSSGFLKLNKKYQAEKITFLPGRAVATREDGSEKAVEGDFGSFLAPLDYLMGHDIKVGDAIELPYILNGAPHTFVCEVNKFVTLTDFKTRVFQVDISSYDKGRAEDETSKDVWKKKGNIRIWFCKEGPFRNRMLKMRIKFRWYLWLSFDLADYTS